ncbi:hypothetical protein BSR29_05150 [Boudabousia liubingyangii]|uniref:Uncharacterized protein n=1 Tax=Boudabousia liubingyangii TaxID=1921764 RepID=A0A1Q5PLE8_9ACTO|nr:hypothetical protein [Boudabousia liubingyangii]OKL47878.1 hypothetical protein BSR29_05150 [Boudabousia liubingyangii]
MENTAQPLNANNAQPGKANTFNLRRSWSRLLLIVAIGAGLVGVFMPALSNFPVSVIEFENPFRPMLIAAMLFYIAALIVLVVRFFVPKTLLDTIGTVIAMLGAIFMMYVAARTKTLLEYFFGLAQKHEVPQGLFDLSMGSGYSYLIYTGMAVAVLSLVHFFAYPRSTKPVEVSATEEATTEPVSAQQPSLNEQQVNLINQQVDINNQQVDLNNQQLGLND